MTKMVAVGAAAERMSGNSSAVGIFSFLCFPHLLEVDEAIRSLLFFPRTGGSPSITLRLPFPLSLQSFGSIEKPCHETDFMEDIDEHLQELLRPKRLL